MFIPYTDASIRLTGRWGVWNNTACATAAGATIEAAFQGRMARLQFNMEFSEHPYPHVWISVDGGARVEAPLSPYLRVAAPDDGEHVVTVIYKGAVEMHHRWHQPLIGKIAFCGLEAESAAELPADNRPVIEFVGDSITEGVLIDAECTIFTNDQLNRPFEDDVTATYAWLTAEALGLRPLMMGYGAVGITKSGCGSVPRAEEAYPYCFADMPMTYPNPPAYILINHGANDRGASAEEYITGYRQLLDLIRRTHPQAKLIALSAFCGAFAKELGAMVAAYNRENGTDMLFIDSTGWVPPEPLHPLRDGHRTIAANLTGILRRELSLPV